MYRQLNSYWPRKWNHWAKFPISNQFCFALFVLCLWKRQNPSSSIYRLNSCVDLALLSWVGKKGNILNSDEKRPFYRLYSILCIISLLPVLLKSVAGSTPAFNTRICMGNLTIQFWTELLGHHIEIDKRVYYIYYTIYHLI